MGVRHMMYVEDFGCFAARVTTLAVVSEYLLSLSGPAFGFQIRFVEPSDHSKGGRSPCALSNHHSDSEPVPVAAAAAAASSEA